jgi:hypothetical protein
LSGFSFFLKKSLSGESSNLRPTKFKTHIKSLNINWSFMANNLACQFI